MGRFRFILLFVFPVLVLGFLQGSCSGSRVGRSGGAASADFNCDGSCAGQNLSADDVRTILKRTISAAKFLGVAATIAVVDRTGNVLALYQMDGAPTTTIIDGQIGASGGLEGKSVPSVLAAISKAGTGAYLSSQGNSFSTRTASQIIQEHFNPGEKNQAGGPLFGVQFSQLLCSDVTVRNPDFADGRSSGAKQAFTGSIGPRFMPLGLSGDAGGIPLYKKGDVVGGLGVEFNESYRVDRNIFDFDDDAEERLALMGSIGFEAPSKRVAPNINVGKSLRYTDLGYADLSDVSVDENAIENARLISLAEFTDGTIRAGSVFGEAASGVLKTTRAGVSSAILVKDDGSNRYPSRAGTVLSGGIELTASEVDSLLDSVLLTASKTRAAIRRPLDTAARVSIWVVDSLGTPLGFVRSEDAPLFGIDVALQKARTAAFFSSSDAGDLLTANSFSDFVNQARVVLGASALTGTHAFTDRAGGNLSRPYFPDGITGKPNGPFSLPFPGTSSASDLWSPFNTGLQFKLIETGLFKALGLVASATFPETCAEGGLSTRIGGGIQIFPGSVPLYRGGILIGAIGISGDGVDQDDLIAFYGASRKGLDAAGHTDVGDSVLGFNAPKNIRADTISLSVENLRLRYVNCPEAPFIGVNHQNVCHDL